MKSAVQFGREYQQNLIDVVRYRFEDGKLSRDSEFMYFVMCFLILGELTLCHDQAIKRKKAKVRQSCVLEVSSLSGQARPVHSEKINNSVQNV